MERIPLRAVSPKFLPEGVHQAKLLSIELLPPPNDNTLKFNFRVTSGEFEGFETSGLVDRNPELGSAFCRWMESLNGVVIEDGTDLTSLLADSTGKMAQVQIAHKPYRNRVFANVVGVGPKRTVPPDQETS